MKVNEKGVEVGDFVRITDNDYGPSAGYIVGEYYEVAKVYPEMVKLQSPNEGAYCFYNEEFDDIRKVNASQQPVENSPEVSSLSNKKIWVKDLTEEQKKAIQDVAFKQGFDWFCREGVYKFLHANSYYFDNDGDITFSTSGHSIYESYNENEEITYEQIFGASPVKEDKETMNTDIPQHIFDNAPEDATHYYGYSGHPLYYKQANGIWYVSDEETNWTLSGNDPEWFNVKLVPLYKSEEESLDNSILATLTTLPLLQQMCAEADVSVEVKGDAYVVISEEDYDEKSVEVYSVDALIETLEDITTVRKLMRKVGWQA